MTTENLNPLEDALPIVFDAEEAFLANLNQRAEQLVLDCAAIGVPAVFIATLSQGELNANHLDSSGVLKVTGAVARMSFEQMVAAAILDENFRAMLDDGYASFMSTMMTNNRPKEELEKDNELAILFRIAAASAIAEDLLDIAVSKLTDEVQAARTMFQKMSAQMKETLSGAAAADLNLNLPPTPSL